MSKVLKILDENEEIILEKMEFGYPGTGLPQLISELLPEIAVNVIKDSRPVDFDEWCEMDAEVEWIEPGHGEIELPDDFLRLISFKMSDWKSSVSSVIFNNADNYPLIFSAARRRMGYRRSPAVALTAGKRRYRLEFIGSSDPAAYVARASYIPRPDSASTSDILRIPRSLIPAVVKATAAAIRD